MVKIKQTYRSNTFFSSFYWQFHAETMGAAPIFVAAYPPPVDWFHCEN